MTVKKVITSLQHPLVQHLVKLRSDSDYRYEQKALMVEGIKPVKEVLTSIKKLIYVDRSPFSEEQVSEEWIVTEAIMKKISGMTTSEGVIAEVKMPSFSSLEGLKRILAFDGINEPGNLGTLMRTALALGWEGVYLLPNSCDPYNEKVIRAARGAHFRLPMRKGTVEELKALVNNNQLEPLVADLKGIAADQIAQKIGKLLVLGNEAHGASEAVKQFCSKVTIPMPGEMESLNVAIAGGILMYVLKG